MGVNKNIDYDSFPRQGSTKGKRVDVAFNYNLKRLIEGTIVRDDVEDPFVTIIKLDDGRMILATECQYSPKQYPPKPR